jgi:effector-binding domain-containing protein
MIDTPRIAHTEAQRIAYIHVVVPRAEIKAVMGPGITEVMAACAHQNLKPTGPWFTHHLNIAPESFDFRICVPVAEPVMPVGRVEAGELPAATVAQTTYRGEYEGLADAWPEFMAWIAAQGLTPAPDCWERYVAGPETSPDPANWRTELNRPLVAYRDG